MEIPTECENSLKLPNSENKTHEKKVCRFVETETVQILKIKKYERNILLLILMLNSKMFLCKLNLTLC